jgi:hypothetical protein
MATYKELHGEAIRDVSSDPTNTGEIFYNSSTDTFRSIVLSTAWSSISPLSSTQGDMAHVGTQDANFVAGGAEGPTTSNVALTQEGNGTGFSLGGNLNTPRRGCAGFGTQTAGVCFGGYTTTYDNATEEYNGTAWTSVNDTPLSPGTAAWGSGGTLTAGIGYGGSDLGPSSPSNNGKQTIEYDGTNWSNANQLSRDGGDGINGFGIQTAALATGQSTPPGSPSATTTVENYDGTNWTSGTATPAGAAYGGSGGVQTAGIIFGGVSDGSPGFPTKVTTTTSWDGSSWSAEPALATARQGTWGGPIGTSSATTMMGGYTGPAFLTNVEEFNRSTTVVTSAAFSSGGTMGTGRYGGQYFGTGKDSQVACGGHLPGSPPTTANSETYNGTTWSEGNNLNTGRYNGAGGGTETAGVISMGRAGPPDYNVTEEYDGSSWTTVTASPETKYRKVGAGTQTSLIVTGGLNSPPTVVYPTTSLEYDGTNWTSGGTAPFGGNYMDGVGNETAAVIFGGNSPNDPAGQNNNLSFDYNGSAWTTNNNMGINHAGQHFCAGTVTDAIVGAGGAPYALAATSETYDGTSFTTNAVLATAGQRGGKGTTSGAAFAVGGHPPHLAVTEEYTAASTAANVKTITTS